MERDLPSRLSDQVLTTELMRLAGCEREATVALISHLAEFDARRLYLPAGFSSSFTYCTQVLRLSEHGAYNRIEAARAAKRCPAVLEMLARGALNLTTIRLLAPHLRDESDAELLAAADGKSKREVEEMVARIAPRQAVPSSIRRLPDVRPVLESGLPPSASPVTASPGLHGASACGSQSVVPPAIVPRPLSTPAHPPAVTPLAEDRYEVRFTASAHVIEKLKVAQALLRHAVPSGDMAEIVDRSLMALLEDLARKKFAATSAPRPGRGTRAGSRRIPAAVLRTVWFRDGGRCRFVGAGERRCSERGFIEFHHLKPHGVGGAPTTENLELRCAMHNRYESELYYGTTKASRPERRRGATNGVLV